MTDGRRGSRMAAGAVAVVALSSGLTLGFPAAAHAAPGWELGAMSVNAAHAVSRGEGVVVAVVDTGVRADHPELQGRAEEGPDMLQETDQDESWYGGHGTAMASNVLDVAPEARVLGIRAIRDREDPEYTESPFEGAPEPGVGNPVDRAVVHAVESGADVISLSIGDSESMFATYDYDLASAIAEANAAGVVVVASAGNEGDMEENPIDGNGVSYPAALPGVIAVGASNPDGTRADFSQVHNYVDVLAPGVRIHSADIAGGRHDVQGTSPAGALVAGVAALIVSAHPDLAPRQVEQVLIETASRHSSGHDPRTGYGVVDAAAALRAAAQLTPEPALIGPVVHDGPSHFGPGDDGTPREAGAALDYGYFGIAAVGLAIGGIMLAVGIGLVRSGRRAGRAWRG